MCVCVYMFCLVHASVVCVWGVGGGWGEVKLKECVCVKERKCTFLCVTEGERESTDKYPQAKPM